MKSEQSERVSFEVRRLTNLITEHLNDLTSSEKDKCIRVSADPSQEQVIIGEMKNWAKQLANKLHNFNFNNDQRDPQSELEVREDESDNYEEEKEEGKRTPLERDYRKTNKSINKQIKELLKLYQSRFEFKFEQIQDTKNFIQNLRQKRQKYLFLQQEGCDSKSLLKQIEYEEQQIIAIERDIEPKLVQFQQTQKNLAECCEQATQSFNDLFILNQNIAPQENQCRIPLKINPQLNFKLNFKESARGNDQEMTYSFPSEDRIQLIRETCDYNVLKQFFVFDVYANNGSNYISFKYTNGWQSPNPYAKNVACQIDQNKKRIKIVDMHYGDSYFKGLIFYDEKLQKIAQCGDLSNGYFVKTINLQENERIIGFRGQRYKEYQDLFTNFQLITTNID